MLLSDTEALFHGEIHDNVLSNSAKLWLNAIHIIDEFASLA
jgi:hypothetical protein